MTGDECVGPDGHAERPAETVPGKLINVPDKIGNTSSFDWAFDTDPGRFVALRR